MMKFLHFWLKCCIWLDDEIPTFLVEMLHMIGWWNSYTFGWNASYGWMMKFMHFWLKCCIWLDWWKFIHSWLKCCIWLDWWKFIHENSTTHFHKKVVGKNKDSK
jgi:hypothetical protein